MQQEQLALGRKKRACNKTTRQEAPSKSLLQILRLLHQRLDQPVELLSPLNRHNMRLVLEKGLGHTPLLTTQLLQQRLAVRESDHAILHTMHDQDPLPADLIRQFSQLRGRLVVPAGGHSLRHEALAVKVLRLQTLGDLAGGEAVAVCRKGLDDRLGRVWAVEPGVGVEVLLCVGNLVVQAAGDEEVDSVAQVLDEADCVYYACGCRHQTQ